MAERLQRQRTKGWRMPEGAVYVGRPSLWGNPWSPSDFRDWPGIETADERLAQAIAQYRGELEHWGLLGDYGWYVSEDRHDAVSAAVRASGAQNMAEYAAVALRGRDLVCWCPLDQPCHADVLLELANG